VRAGRRARASPAAARGAGALPEVDGLCAEHRRAPEPTSERNWFFRLSRYEDQLLALIESGRLRIEPEPRRNEVIAFIRGGLQDFSVSRSRERAHGWGIPVPDDPSQVVYVWFDALGNYLSALGYGTDAVAHREWWVGSDERVHVIGKGIIRFHAVYWPAILLSAGERLPTAIFVHDYLTVDGRKLSKSLGVTADPGEIAIRYGSAGLRWWLVRDVPRAQDADFREELLAARANELADGLGNLVNRTITLIARHRPDGVVPVDPRSDASRDLQATVAGTPGRIDDALARFDLRAAATALWDLVDAANRCVTIARPWELARAEIAGQAASGADLDDVLSVLVTACRLLAREAGPFLPAASERLERALDANDPALGRRLFTKVPPRG